MMRWQRFTFLPRPACAVCGVPAMCEYTVTRQCEPGNLAYWEPLCSEHSKADTPKLDASFGWNGGQA